MPLRSLSPATRGLLASALLCLLTAPAILAEEAGYAPAIAPASPDAARAIAGFRIPEGMQAELAAAEPQLANPVAFTVSPTGDVYVCETFRQQQGVEDNRGHMNWLLQDLQLQSIEERIAMFRSAEALLAAVAAGVEARRLALSTDLAPYFAAAARYEAQLEALQRAIAVAEMVAENYHERYQRGQVSLQDLLRAEENRITVEVDISGALRDQALNRIAYACSYGLQLHPTF